MDYPDIFLRGISTKDYITSDGSPSSSLFYFTEKSMVPSRSDGYQEESIFWKDDEEALTLILNQVKEDGKIQFKGGAAVMDRAAIDIIRRLPNVKEVLSYERKPIEGNIYHGNLLLMKNIEKKTMQKIAASIALCCMEIIPQNNE